MKTKKPFILLVILLAYVVVCLPLLGFAQTAESLFVPATTSDAIKVTMGDGAFGVPYTFSVNPPPITKSWLLTISEFNGRTIFSDEGFIFPREGYVWTPSSDLSLYASIYYTVAISFEDMDDRIIKTEASSFYIPTAMQDNIAPLIFFEADATDLSKYLYQDSSIDEVVNLIVEQATTKFANSRILLRGHAAFISKTQAERQKEQLDLLELSRKRSLVILDRLIEVGIDSTRLYYEAVGGSAEISTEEEQRWKNRRVEVFFVDDVSEVPESIVPNNEVAQEDSTEEDVAALQEQAEYIVEPLLQEKPKPVVQENVPPWPDVPILGKGQVQPEYLLKFILYYTPTEDTEYINYLKRIIMYYINESRRENVNHDVAFVQMLLETNYLRFSGQVRKEQYNFAGIGVVNDANQGNWFSTELIGVRAHIQHLKGYATTTPLRGSIVDPRYPILDKLGLLGSSPLVSNLTGRWATDPNYSRSILIIMRRLYNYTNALIEADEEY